MNLLLLFSFLALICVAGASLDAFYGANPPQRCGLDLARAKLAKRDVDPELRKRAEELQEHFTAQRSLGERSAVPVYIPVNYHILTTLSDNEGTLGTETIYYQTYVLNKSFNKHGYYFYTKSIEEHVNTAWTSDCQTNSDAIGNFLGDNPATEMNVYTCVTVGTTGDDSAILGFTYLPEDYAADDPRNGVFVWYRSLPNAGAAYYGRGDTLVHEVGHYIGLKHTFEGDCSSVNDEVADTPACTAYTGIDCPSDRDTCPQPGYDDVRNFMDYSIDSCLDHFTTGQIARVDSQVATFKPLLLTNTNGSDPVMNFPDFFPDPAAAVSYGSWVNLLFGASAPPVFDADAF